MVRVKLASLCKALSIVPNTINNYHLLIPYYVTDWSMPVVVPWELIKNKKSPRAPSQTH